jgi:hypothetical protein
MSGDAPADDPDEGEASQRTLDEYDAADTDPDRIDRLERDVELLKDLTGELTGTLSDVVDTIDTDDDADANERTDVTDDKTIRGFE